MLTPPIVRNVLGQRGLVPTAYYTYWELIDRLDGKGIVIRFWDVDVLGPEPSQAEVDLATSPLISLIVTPIEGGVIATSQVTNAGYIGLVNWRCIAPDGTVYAESGNMVAGADNWEIVMGALGNYTISSWVTGYGYAEETYTNG